MVLRLGLGYPQPQFPLVCRPAFPEALENDRVLQYCQNFLSGHLAAGGKASGEEWLRPGTKGQVSGDFTFRDLTLLSGF